ncbi:carotenoid isomerooxygenase-like [Mercenaria mercenaria]|uniref:carotenoid isomerooxygenase-like n=1 Tax=Mercenaria mercenaria TaxID=6596 RepID=UPI00234E6594|nr:carotenoid isomerooxygenase-like [Mercenaria mercenaria]XP_053387891.1 carotenoid isomerooxygenase-like [Mercenaria mercenaria]
MMHILLVLLSIAILSTAHAFSGNELTEMLKDGLGNVVKETINGVVTLEKGSIPVWLSGNFIRHACGVFGETSHRNKDLPNYIEHLFDCFVMGSKYSIDNGQVTFTNRWYDTTVEDIYNSYGREMNASSMFVHSVFSKVNAKQIDKWNGNMSSHSKVSEIPNVSWWLVDNQAIAMTEQPIGVIIDPHDVVQKGYMQYDDDNLGVPDTQQYLFSNNPAHEQTEPDGTLWSTVSVVKFETPSHLKIRRIVYKIGADTVRHVVGTYHYEDSDITRCKGDNSYPDFGARFGYLHSFAMTKNYIVLPETAFMDDPCVFTRYDQYKPFFPQGFRYEPNGYSRLLVMRKSDGVFIANITMPPFFATHQLGAYEDGNLIHMDMLTYNDSGIYDRHMFLDNLLSENQYTTDISRITISLSGMSARMRSLRANGKPPTAFEMPNINYDYYGKKYTYAYLAKNFDRRDQNAITKLNVDTGVEIEFVLPEGMFVQEPQFVARPGAVFEDDGVILAQGVDGRKHKAFMVIVDAGTMMLIGYVTAPDIALFGLHNRFFPMKVGRTTVDTPGGIVG